MTHTHTYTYTIAPNCRALSQHNGKKTSFRSSKKKFQLFDQKYNSP